MTAKGAPNFRTDSLHGAHLRGHAVRSRYVGYDCYAYGPITGPRKVRCILRAGAMPARIGQDIRDLMPLEFHSPTGILEEAHRLIDALYLLDVPTIQSTIKQFPDHNTMLEPWIDRALRWRAAHAATREDADTSKRILKAHRGYQQPKFPPVVHYAQRLRSIPLAGYEIVLATVYFLDGTPALRADIYPNGRTNDKVLRLSRVYIDLMDSSYEVIEHYPGRYQGVGLDHRFLQLFLDSDDAQIIKRRTARDNPHIREARARLQAAESASEPMRARRTAQAARELHGLTEEQEAVFAPHLVAGTAR